jgi:hypothetical protein
MAALIFLKLHVEDDMDLHVIQSTQEGEFK